MEELNIIDDIHLLIKLRNYLNYELSSFTLYLISFFAMITLWLCIAAAIIFSVFMIYTLYKNNKTGWLAAFVVFVIVPVLLIIFLVQDYVIFYSGLYVVLGVFFLYCFLLRLSVNEWVESNFWRNQREEGIKKKKNIDIIEYLNKR